MRRVRLVAGHAVGFARYWNRPMSRRWRNDFLFQLGILAVLGLQGAPYDYVGMAFFALTTASWTLETIREYREGWRRIGRDDYDSLKGGPHG